MNKLPSSVLKNEIPFVKLHGTSPDYKSLKDEPSSITSAINLGKVSHTPLLWIEIGEHVGEHDALIIDEDDGLSESNRDQTNDNLLESSVDTENKNHESLEDQDSTGGHHMVIRSKSKQIAPHTALLATNGETYIEPRTINQALRLPHWCATKKKEMVKHLEAKGSSANATLYKSIIGSLQYLTLTRPDITSAVNLVSQFMHTSNSEHLQVVKRTLRYVRGSTQLGLRLIKQQTTAKSIVEDDYRAMASTPTENTRITYILRDIGVSLSTAPILFFDNLSALHMTVNPVIHARTKHVEMDYHLITRLTFVRVDTSPTLVGKWTSGLLISTWAILPS
ncbi:hypothetical protein BC332_14480 [Capsicum chinense]|nr:hypothetical protein BC332_14480 [Capsicum chinense]